jgi:membrane protein implicated in regulation of membrane protease activity
MALFLLFILVAIALGIIGAVVKGLFWLLVIGVLVVIVDLIVLGARLGRRRNRPGQRPGR